MLKLIFFLLATPGILFSVNLSEKLKPVSENKNKHHVKKPKQKYPNTVKHIVRTTKSSVNNILNKNAKQSSTRGLLADFKKSTKKNPKLIKARNKAVNDRRRQAAKSRRK